jgi:hypothetical protein
MLAGCTTMQMGGVGTSRAVGAVDGSAIFWTKGHKLGHGAFGAVFSALDLKTGGWIIMA